MNYYIENENGIVIYNENKEKIINSLKFLENKFTEVDIKETEKSIAEINGGFYFEDDPEYKKKKREEIDKLTLTPADVERTLYRTKQMDFEDLKALIEEKITGLDVKALSIEFRARDFYRGALYGNRKLFDIVGQLLDYTPEDMDFLFINKKLPDDPKVNDPNY